MQINVAFCNRPSYDNPLGGDAIQMLKTKEWLEILYGIHISIITHPNELTVNFNIVHVFNFATYEITNGFVERPISWESLLYHHVFIGITLILFLLCIILWVILHI